MRRAVSAAARLHRAAPPRVPLSALPTQHCCFLVKNPSPTGQLELSGTPSARLHDVVSEVERHVRTVKAVGRQQGLRLLALGPDPVTAEWPEALRPPRPHHRLMEAAIAPGGTAPGADILYGSASVQVSLDFSDERDMRAKMSVASALQPIATALLANSPFSGGAPNGLRSARAAAWERLPLPERAGLLEFVMSPDFSFEAWADWAARLPVLWLARGFRSSSTGCRRLTIFPSLTSSSA